MTSMSQSLVAQSPRLTPRPVPIASYAIMGSVLLLFIALVAQAFFRTGLASWSVGLVYIAYDTALLIFTASKTHRLMAPTSETQSTGKPSDARPSLGVIIAAHNEARVLGITIDTLTAQSDPPDLILIADDGSSDDTPAELMRLYGLAMPTLGAISDPAPGLPILRWLRVPHGGKARALNAAIQQIDTDVVLTVDADTLLDPGALAAMRGAFAQERSLVAATGVLTPICGPTLSGRIFQWFQTYEYVRNFLSRYAWMRVDSLLLISGAFAAFRRDALITVGGFDPACMVEDYELIHRLHRHAADQGLGWTIRVIGAATARTDAPASLMAFLRQRRRWFGGYLQTQYWNRDMIGNPHFGSLGTAQMPVKTLDTVQPIYGIAAFIILVTLVVTGNFLLAWPILVVMIVKIVFDLAYHLWSLRLYARWTGNSEGLGTGWAIVAAVLEPFTFQLLRHIGATWGWYSFLTGRETWGRQRRTAIEGAGR